MTLQVDKIHLLVVQAYGRCIEEGIYLQIFETYIVSRWPTYHLARFYLSQSFTWIWICADQDYVLQEIEFNVYSVV